MKTAFRWVSGLGVDPERLLWVAIALAGVALLWGIGRAFEWLREMRQRQLETAARLQLLETWARNVQTQALGATALFGGKLPEVKRPGSIHDEDTKVGVPTKTSLTALVREAHDLSVQNFEEMHTELQVGGTSVLTPRAKRAFSANGG